MRVGSAVTCVAVALAALVVAAAPAAAQQYLNILDFGAVPDADTAAAGWANGAALNAALTASNTSAAPLPSDRIVLVPGGHTFTFIPDANTLSGLHNIWLQIDGEIVALKQQNLTTKTAVWPYDPVAGKFHDMIAWNDCTDMWVYGSGRVEGNGYEWWWASVLKTIDDASRPHMFVVNGGARLHWSGLRLKNSPEYHMILTDIDTLVVEDMDITVDVDVQRKLLADHGLLDEFGIPMFPLNTDGIDPAGKNVLIRNVSISNFDDAVAVKPCNGGFRYATCSQDIVVEDSRVTWGLGMTIGSVPPHEQINCVRNVIFRRVNFTFPIKAVYVKTNPGTTGSGVISNITYEDLRATDAVWWAIYIGPQQQKQPDGDGAGCLLYPINPDCPCQPRVPMDHITLRNVQIDGALFSPGIIRCNATAPCTDFVFDNVQVTKYGEWPWGQTAYKVDNVYGTCTNCSPNIPFTGANPPEPQSDAVDAAADADAAAADANVEADPFAPVKRAFNV